MSDTQQLAESIILEVANAIAAEGFKFDIASSAFVKQEGDIRFVFQVALAERHGVLACTPDVGVRSNRVEQVFHRTSEFSDADAQNTATLGVNVKLLTRSSSYDVSVANAAEVEDAAEKLLRAFREVAVPYFAEFGSLKGIDSALNSDPSKRCIHMINERARCSKGLIVAKLLERADYQQLLEAYVRNVASAGEMTYEKYFLPLVDDLEQLRVS